MNKVKFIIILILITLSLTACYAIAPGAENKMKDLIRQESEAFISQAKKQYGDDVEVIDITTERRVSYDTVWIGATVYAGDNLFGTIKSDEHGEFNATYLTDSNVIISHKNENRITKSAYDDLASTKLNILDIQLRNSAREKHMLTDDIKSYTDIVDNGEFVTIRIITDSDISKLEVSDFARPFEIMKRHQDQPHILSIEIVQIEDPKKTPGLSSKWNSQGTNFYGMIKYACQNNIQQDKEVVQYGIVASIDVRSAYEGKIEYINTKGKEIIYKVNGNN